MDSYNADDIKYMALSLLGISSKPDFIADEEPEVKKINFVYPSIMYQTLQRFQWGFARHYAELEKSDIVSGRFRNNFILPEDFLYLRGCYSNDRYSATIRERELNVTDGLLNVDSDKCFIEYTRYVEETKLPQYFINYIKYKLACEICMDVTGDTDLLQIYTQKEQFEWINSTNIDSRQQRVRSVDTGAFINCRR